MISVLGKELSVQDDEEDDDDEYISSAFEQCVFCLYNHPNKRGRARYVNLQLQPTLLTAFVPFKKSLKLYQYVFLL